MTEDAKPAWQRETPAELRWPAAVATTVAIALQIGLPDQLTLAPRLVLPGVEAVLLVVIIGTSGTRLDRSTGRRRHLALVLVAVASLANGYSAARLVVGLVDGTVGSTAAPLLLTGGAIYLTNVLVFALWYWELDRGGPAERAKGHNLPDFLFPQMSATTLAPTHWEPRFVDYLYVSFTNATAFSPTDTMPLTRWAKLTMLGQSGIALVTVALVVARAVNILGG